MKTPLSLLAAALLLGYVAGALPTAPASPAPGASTQLRPPPPAPRLVPHPQARLDRRFHGA